VNSKNPIISDIFEEDEWSENNDFDFSDITYHRAKKYGTVRIAINRPEVRNAFRPKTVDELYSALDHARMTTDVGSILLTGNGPSAKDGEWAFCSGGDQRIRGKDGYEYDDDTSSSTTGRLHILEVQRLIRFMPKIVIAVIPGWAAGGGHSFDGGYGSAYLARQVGQKFAREIFFLGRTYDAEEAFQMGMVNKVVDHESLEIEALKWAGEINSKSPTAIRMLKFAFNLIDDGLVGQQLFAGEATRLAYSTDEASEGREAFLEKRESDFSSFPYHY